MLVASHFDICSLAPLKPRWLPIFAFFDQSFSWPPSVAFHLQSFILYNTNTAFLSSSCVHVWTFSNCLRTGLMVWMMNTLTEAIYEDQTLTLLICLLSWASRTRLGWNRRANAENGILVTSFTDITSDEQVLTTCCECWEGHFHDIMRLEIWMRRLFWLGRQALPSYIYNCNTCSWLGGCSRQFISVLKVFCRWSE